MKNLSITLPIIKQLSTNCFTTLSNPMTDLKTKVDITRIPSFFNGCKHMSVCVPDSPDQNMGHQYQQGTKDGNETKVMKIIPPKGFHFCGNPKCEYYFQCPSKCECFGTYTFHVSKFQHNENCKCKCETFKKMKGIVLFKCSECKP